MKKILFIITIIAYIFIFIPTVTAQIKIDYASTSVNTTGIERGMEESIKHTTNIQVPGSVQKEEKIEEIGVWTAIFFIIVVILGTFVAR